MELKYKQAIQNNNLSVGELPEDAQTGIDNINDVLRALNMLEKKGKKPTAKTLRKLKAMDKWVHYEILDYLHDTDKNVDEIPHDSDEIVDDIKDDIKTDTTTTNDDEKKPVELDDHTKLGLKIEEGFSKMISEKSEWDIEEIRKNNKPAYDLLFDTYEEDEENGITTSNYSLIEQEDLSYTLKTT